MALVVHRYREEDRPRWQAYASTAAGASVYHDITWKEIVEATFGHRTHYLQALDEQGRVAGLLPLVHLKSLLFGSFLVSMPYYNYGGIVADSPESRDILLREAIAIAIEQGARHIELRHTEPLEGPVQTKTEKVSMRLQLPVDAAPLWAALGAKLRSQIRRPQKEGMSARIGREEQLDAFYRVFSTNMRDLGTPVYPKRFFEAILARFPTNTWLCSVYTGREAVASGLLIGFRDRLEIPWASSLRAYNLYSPNMLLYWSALEFACQRGYREFDFGRSSRDAGTYRFKEQWGAKPVQLYWHYWLRRQGPLPQLNPQNARYRLAINAWRQLPVAVTRLLGPLFVRSLP
jgi:FemAB-related protein (PEP-CTERM system-associated)